MAPGESKTFLLRLPLFGGIPDKEKPEKKLKLVAYFSL
jgi:hypothetical protein